MIMKTKKYNILKKSLSLFLALLLTALVGTGSFAADVGNNETVSFFIEGEINNDYAFEVLKRLNSLRASLKVGALEMDAELYAVAKQRAAELSIYYAHERPDSSMYYDFDAVKGCSSAENIAIGYLTPEEVMQGWTDSKSHYKNMVNSVYTQAGIACFESSNGILCWVQVFSNGAHTDVKKSGTETLRFEIKALTKMLSLAPSKDLFVFGENTVGTEFVLDIYNVNKGFVYARQRILPDTATQRSLNSGVAESLGGGRFKVKGLGTTTVYSSLSKNAEISAEVSVVNENIKIGDLTFTLNEARDGYILSECDKSASGKITVPTYCNGIPVTEIGASAFCGCEGVTEVVLPETVIYIRQCAFCSCTALKSITIPDSVSLLGAYSLGCYEKDGYHIKNTDFVIKGSNDSLGKRYADINGFTFECSAVYGDANGDGKVDLKDVVLLRQYMANYVYGEETSSVAVKPGADANGDGKVDLKDVVLLRQYMANYSYDTESSTVVLGPR